MTALSHNQRQIITEARDMAMGWAKHYVGHAVEYDFLAVAQKLDVLLRPKLIRELNKRAREASTAQIERAVSHRTKE